MWLKHREMRRKNKVHLKSSLFLSCLCWSTVIIYNTYMCLSPLVPQSVAVIVTLKLKVSPSTTSSQRGESATGSGSPQNAVYEMSMLSGEVSTSSTTEVIDCNKVILNPVRYVFVSHKHKEVFFLKILFSLVHCSRVDKMYFDLIPFGSVQSCRGLWSLSNCFDFN